MAGFIAGLELIDFGRFDQSNANVIEPFEQALLAIGIDFEFHHAAIGAENFLFDEIDGQSGIGAALGIFLQAATFVIYGRLPGPLSRHAAAVAALIGTALAGRRAVAPTLDPQGGTEQRS